MGTDDEAQYVCIECVWCGENTDVAGGGTEQERGSPDSVCGLESKRNTTRGERAINILLAEDYRFGRQDDTQKGCA